MDAILRGLALRNVLEPDDRTTIDNRLKCCEPCLPFMDLTLDGYS